jgi:hypothetical protein
MTMPDFEVTLTKTLYIWRAIEADTEEKARLLALDIEIVEDRDWHDSNEIEVIRSRLLPERA